jgi:hypothetical protein
MWQSPRPLALPRTKSAFYVTSRRGELFVVKPGKAYSQRGSSWAPVRATGLLNRKIDRVVVSPNGNASLHLPKMTGLLAAHPNHGDAVVITFPFPQHPHGGTATYTEDAIAPTGDTLIMTTPHQRILDVPYAFGQHNKLASMIPTRVKGLATSENGEAIAVAIDEQLWIWQQYPEAFKGHGFWTDLTLNQHFNVGVEANHPISQNGRVFHGYRRPRQTFTLNPVLAPNLPQNSAVSYQDLCMFDNPDEGRGIVCLTALLPPCRPFDTLYLFNSICVFKASSRLSRGLIQPCP